MMSESFAASVTVSDNDPGLTGVASATATLLNEAGLKIENEGIGDFVVEAKQVREGSSDVDGND